MDRFLIKMGLYFLKNICYNLRKSERNGYNYESIKYQILDFYITGSLLSDIFIFEERTPLMVLQKIKMTCGCDKNDGKF